MRQRHRLSHTDHLSPSFSHFSPLFLLWGTQKRIAVNNSWNRREIAFTSTVGIVLCEPVRSSYCFFFSFYTSSAPTAPVCTVTHADTEIQSLTALHLHTGDQLQQHQDVWPHNYYNQAGGGWKFQTRTSHRKQFLYLAICKHSFTTENSRDESRQRLSRVHSSAFFPLPSCYLLSSLLVCPSLPGGHGRRSKIMHPNNHFFHGQFLLCSVSEYLTRGKVITLHNLT